jgi:Domain of unknown function (DUF4189)
MKWGWGYSMEILKKVLGAGVGIAFWAVALDWFFLDGYYNPLIGQTSKPASVASQGNQPIRTEHMIISIFTSTEKPGRSQQLHFSHHQPREAAIASAAKKCADSIASSGGDFVCEEVSFLYEGCYVRYRLGDGNYPAVGATQAEAAAKAEQKCQSDEHTTPFTCIRDTNMCVDGGDNQGTRAWESGAMGLTEIYRDESNQKTSMLFVGQGSSLKAQRASVENKCRDKSGQECKTILTVTGDECVAFAFASKGAHHWAYGAKQDKFTRMSEAQRDCTSKAGHKCTVAWKCADMLSAETE